MLATAVAKYSTAVTAITGSATTVITTTVCNFSSTAHLGLGSSFTAELSLLRITSAYSFAKAWHSSQLGFIQWDQEQTYFLVTKEKFRLTSARKLITKFEGIVTEELVATRN